MRTTDFFVANPVFSLDDAVRYLAPPRGRLGAVERLKHHLETGRLKLVMKGVYAVAPAGVSADRFHPNPFLVASAVRPDAIFSHHSALDLLGTAHSLWHGCTVYTAQRRRPFALEGTTVQFLNHPGMLKSDAALHLGTRKIEHRGKMLETTGPERTLLEGFRRPGLVGGLEELVNSAAGFPILHPETPGGTPSSLRYCKSLGGGQGGFWSDIREPSTCLQMSWIACKSIGRARRNTSNGIAAGVCCPRGGT